MFSLRAVVKHGRVETKNHVHFSAFIKKPEMSPKNDLKESYEVQTKNGAFYLGGKLQWSEDGKTLLCPANDVLNLLDVDTGTIRGKLGEGGEVSDTILCFAENCERVVSAHRSGLFKLWDATECVLVKTWKSVHRGPVAQLAFGAGILASGGTDGVVRLWNLDNNSCTHALRGCQGVISVLEFHNKKIYASSDDVKIRAWDITTGEITNTLTGHFSKITGLAFADNVLVSCARDKVLITWDLNTGVSLKTIPVYETLESVFLYPMGVVIPNFGKCSGLFAATAGDSGTVRIFDCKTGNEVFKQQDSKIAPAADGGLSVVQLLVNRGTKRCAVVAVDHNIILYKLKSFVCDKQFVGFLDEVLDVSFLGPSNGFLAVATNSPDIKIYNLANQDCQLLRGHSDFVLSLSVSAADSCLLLSGGKDGLVCLWKLIPESGVVNLVTTGNRHTAAVTTVNFFNLCDQFVSASLDTTLKLWKNEGNAVTVIGTEVAHAKDINCVTVSPNDKIAASASQDKTIKLWNLPNLTLLGVLSGHRRGVWCVRFSPVDQIILSSSADCSMKLWNIPDMTCLQTFEGHESSVMRAEFLSRGMQIISCSGDGLLKLWTVKTSECVATFDAHEGKIWAMDVSENEDQLITAGADSQIIIWRNTTEEKKLAAIEAREAILQQEQELANLIRAERLLDALKLALSLDRPYKVLNIVKDVMRNGQIVGLREALNGLGDTEKEKLLECAAAWNCNAKHCAAAQLVISIFLDEIAAGTLALKNLPGFIQEVLPYTDRHFKRLTQTLQGLQLLNYTLRKINPALS